MLYEGEIFRAKGKLWMIEILMGHMTSDERHENKGDWTFRMKGEFYAKLLEDKIPPLAEKPNFKIDDVVKWKKNV